MGLEQFRLLYERAVYAGDAEALTGAERELDALEAATALARGQVLHRRFLHERARPDATPVEDPAELPLFERALALFRAAGDVRGEAEALFWIGCLHQVVRRDNETAVPLLERAARTDDPSTRSEALRHLGTAAFAAGRLDEAREHLKESSRLRRASGELPGVAANLVGLAYVAAAQDRRADAVAALDEAHEIAQGHDAHAVLHDIAEARAAL
ncbi:tetratricopeptide repeat protein [Dactylosporangium cerinum]|uniref:Tetratricopeptide repeat protein n=1 Tax=Dactylosporangium cerinum TaxID=1434730 RepID=A0ABV9VTU1_9ACTN